MARAIATTCGFFADEYASDDSLTEMHGWLRASADASRCCDAEMLVRVRRDFQEFFHLVSRRSPMKANGTHRRSIARSADGFAVDIIDQRHLPHRLVIARLETLDDTARAIREMWVRGAPLIGATAAHGFHLAMLADSADASIEGAYVELLSTRPTANNLRWALDQMRDAVTAVAAERRAEVALRRAEAICDDDVATNQAIGRHGLALLAELYREKGERLDILTHCNAGWLATVDWGTALAPIFMAHDAGIPVHVWVDETRPRLQGALTAWELAQYGIAHTIVVDNAGGHLMQHGMVDACFVGADRVTASGDVCNKIGTYLKALAAKDNAVPLYAAVPYSTIDWTLDDGVAQIPIEERDPEEVRAVRGEDRAVHLFPAESPVANHAFDVTPARLVTAIITERGICPPHREGLLALYPERRASVR
jgi:methylthioribose-1-phosphate isomerase